MAQACIAGDVYLRQDRPKDYIAQYQAAAAIAPENEALQAQLASLRSPGSNSQTSNTYSLQRARELAALGELSEAIAIYEQLSEAEPGRTDVRSDLGMLYQKAGKTDQAIQQFQKVLERDPANLDIHNNLGIAYMQNGIYVKAENEFLTILRIKPDYVQAEVNLGLTYARTGRKDEAIQMLEKALVREPDNANIKKVLEQLKK
jgi:tetratricopeptide (TPR) repeat protein